MPESESLFVKRYRALGLTGGAMAEAEIARLEAHLGLRIPDAYRAYLEIAGGSPPPELVGSDCYGKHLYDLRQGAVELLEENGEPFALPQNAIVFLMHQGYQFFYFLADGVDEDPPVLYYIEESESADRPYERFSDWVAAIV